MIVKLMEEANEEAEHKGWCDTELSTNEQTRKEKSSSVEILTAEVDELEATIGQLSAQITELTQNVADLDAAIAEATTIREEEKAKNTQTIKDAKAAQGSSPRTSPTWTRRSLRRPPSARRRRRRTPRPSRTPRRRRWPSPRRSRC